jgi:hypothetical protein
MGVTGTDEKEDQIPLDAADVVRDVRKIVYVINRNQNLLCAATQFEKPMAPIDNSIGCARR